MSQQTKTIRWGIIGLGKIANKFAQDILTINNCQLYAVASRSQEKANEFAKTYNAEKAYNSYDDLAKDPNIDAVYIATPHALHKENAILCLKNKKAVLCEKPFAMDKNEVEDMITVAKENNVLLMEALWTYFLPHYKFALQHLENKTFGNITKLEADFGFKPTVDMNSRVFKKSLGGGSLLDIGIYPIFAALSTLGQPNTLETNATFFENDVDSSCTITFDYNNSIKAHLKSTLLEKTPTEAIFYCENGIVKINSRFQEPSTVSLIPNEGKEEHFDFGYTTNGYNFETIHFNQLLRDGKTESDVMSFEFSKTLITMLDTVRQKIGLHYE